MSCNITHRSELEPSSQDFSVELQSILALTLVRRELFVLEIVKEVQFSFDNLQPQPFDSSYTRTRAHLHLQLHPEKVFFA